MYKTVVAELGKIPGNRRMPLHHESVHHADEYARDNEHLMDLLNNKMQEIPGVTATETLISLEKHQEGDSYLPREITNNNGFLERISSFGPCHRYLHIPHHRLVSPRCCETEYY